MTVTSRRRWSWEIGTLLGISIRVHVTLLGLLAVVAIAIPVGGGGLTQALVQVLLVVAVFACVLLHELSHALIGRRFGCPTREILLLPIGGIAQMERMPQRPAHELLVALVGPATNLALAALLGVVIAIVGWPFDARQVTLPAALIVPLFWINLALAAFNLLPAFPMDGGRVLRALLTTRVGRARATRIASVVGKALAIVFVVVGLTVGGATLAIVGLFVWLAADREAAMVSLFSTLAHATVGDAMNRAARVVDASLPIEVAAAHMLADGQHELAVSEHGRIAGVITIGDLARWMNEPAPHPAVGGAMHRDVPVVDVDAPLEAVLAPLERVGVVLVGRANAIVGLLTAEQLAAYAALHPVVDDLRAN